MIGASEIIELAEREGGISDSDPWIGTNLIRLIGPRCVHAPSDGADKPIAAPDPSRRLSCSGMVTEIYE